MTNGYFYRWCHAATARIVFPPDKEKVYQELLSHLEDHRDALVEQGIDTEEANKMACEAMGSAEELAPQLAALHKPFWGYALRACRIAAVVMLCMCIISGLLHLSDLNIEDPTSRDFDLFSADSYGGDTGRELLYLGKPNQSFSSDGSTFTLTDVAFFTEIYEETGEELTRLYCLIDQRSLLPVAVRDDYYYYHHTIGCYFFATDSLGNYYYSYYETPGNVPHVNPFGGQTGLFTYTHEWWISDVPREAEWVDIQYRRDGRELTFRIYLTGGDGA